MLSEKEIESIRSRLPNSPGVGTEECLKRCNIQSSIKNITAKSKTNSSTNLSISVYLVLVLPILILNLFF
jgi:hypothetical protein